ncbi:hypothetical protein ACE8FZ_19945 [Peribacillus frigoritolerans]|uniref:hypothetical protein n=1 Tax=Peribacillus frigoritolerans TaxID=450367 RepID=UPI0035CEF67B
MLSRNTLRNIYKKDFKTFFGHHKVKLRSKRIESNPGEERYTPISRMIHEELATGTFSPEEVDEFLFTHLFYGINNWHYIYHNGDVNKILLSDDSEKIVNFF